MFVKIMNFKFKTLTGQLCSLIQRKCSISVTQNVETIVDARMGVIMITMMTMMMTTMGTFNQSIKLHLEVDKPAVTLIRL